MHTGNRGRTCIVLSEQLWKGPRLVRTRGHTMFIERVMDSIDATKVDRKLFSQRHSCVFNHEIAIADLRAALAGARASTRTSLTRKPRGGDVYWRLE